ncbi:MAG: TIGR00303 family protein [Synergistaceae bacterium]|nr:TIGR00303 family protein [Synergistaceae bacterium]
MFFLFISGTEISKVPGLSAAGANPEVIPFTSPADADVIRFGFPKAIDCFPMDPQGHPTPAIITRAAVIEAGIPVTVVRCGSYLPPAPPYVETGAEPGRDPRLERAVPDAKKIFERSRFLSRNIDPSTKMVMLAESIPGGTTTALMILRALGIDGMVSSGGHDNPIGLKEDIWRGVSKRLGIREGALAGDPLRAVEELGDPMQASILGFILGLDKRVEIVLAGGTQMTAVAALLKNLDPCRKPIIATTKYVADDKSSSFQKIADLLEFETYVAKLDLSASPHKGLRDYEEGYVKEGVGAGGSVLYAERLGVAPRVISDRTDMLYSEILREGSLKNAD